MKLINEEIAKTAILAQSKQDQEKPSATGITAKTEPKTKTSYDGLMVTDELKTKLYTAYIEDPDKTKLKELLAQYSVKLLCRIDEANHKSADLILFQPRPESVKKSPRFPYSSKGSIDRRAADWVFVTFSKDMTKIFASSSVMSSGYGFSDFEYVFRWSQRDLLIIPEKNKNNPYGLGAEFDYDQLARFTRIIVNRENLNLRYEFGYQQSSRKSEIYNHKCNIVESQEEEEKVLDVVSLTMKFVIQDAHLTHTKTAAAEAEVEEKKKRESEELQKRKKKVKF